MELTTDFSTLYYRDNEKKKFYGKHNELMNKLGCYYLSYYVIDYKNKTRISFNSNADWEKEYLNQNLIDECHIHKYIKQNFSYSKKNHLILPWELVKPDLSIEKEICLYRDEFYIGQGISFCTKHNDVVEYIAICPDHKQKNFCSLVSKNIDIIQDNVRIFRENTKALLSGKFINEYK